MVKSLVVMCLALSHANTRFAAPHLSAPHLRELWRLHGSGSLALTPRSQAVARPDGSFWLTLPERCQFVLVHPDGRVGRPVGGCGNGAGQFRELSAAGTYHDTLWIWDRGVGRLTLFAGDDPKLQRMVRLDFSRTSFRGSAIPQVRAILGRNLVLAHHPAEPMVFGHRDPVRVAEQLMTLSLDGSVLPVDVDLGASGNTYRMYLRRAGTGPGNEVTYLFANPYPPATMTAIAHNGSSVAIVRQADSMMKGKAPTFMISVLSPTLRPLRQWSIPFLPLATDSARITAAHETLLSSLKQSMLSLDAKQRAWIKRAFEARPAEPPVAAVGPLSAGGLWFKCNRPAARPGDVLWQRVNLTTGQSLIVSLPRNVEVIEATTTDVLGLEQGTNGSVTVVAYRLEGAEREDQ